MAHLMIRTCVESPFWPNHTLEPPHSWTQWSDQFQLAIIAKENLDIESLNGPEVPETQTPILEKQQEASQTRREPVERRGIRTQGNIMTPPKKSGSMRRKEKSRE